MLFRDKYQEHSQINPESLHPRGSNLELCFCEAYLNQTTLREIYTVYSELSTEYFSIY